MRKIKDNLGTFIITLVVLLIPMIVGVILWNKLPNEMATHWGANNFVSYGSNIVLLNSYFPFMGLYQIRMVLMDESRMVR